MDENATTPASPPITDAMSPNEQLTDVVGSGGEDRVSEPPERVPMTAHPLPPDPGTGERGQDGFGMSEFYQQLYAEWDELAARRPPPTLDDVRPEWAWVHAHLADNTIDPENRYWGLHVAVYNQGIVGADVDPVQLQVTKARELGIHPERMVVVYFGES